jgi:hypothetical protein
MHNTKKITKAILSKEACLEKREIGSNECLINAKIILFGVKISCLADGFGCVLDSLWVHRNFDH